VKVATGALSESNIDMIAIGRQMICDPDTQDISGFKTSLALFHTEDFDIRPFKLLLFLKFSTGLPHNVHI